MCSDQFTNGVEVGKCPDCGGPIDSDGDACYGCNYAPISCETCGARECDEGC